MISPLPKDVPFEDFKKWMDGLSMAKLESFKQRDACECPLAVFFKEIYQAPSVRVSLILAAIREERSPAAREYTLAPWQVAFILGYDEANKKWSGFDKLTAGVERAFSANIAWIPYP